MMVFCAHPVHARYLDLLGPVLCCHTHPDRTVSVLVMAAPSLLGHRHIQSAHLLQTSMGPGIPSTIPLLTTVPSNQVVVDQVNMTSTTHMCDLSPRRLTWL